MCRSGSSIAGTADLKLSSGKTSQKGLTLLQCENECSSNKKCKSIVVRSKDGYCELWSRTDGRKESSYGYSHCVAGHGRLGGFSRIPAEGEMNSPRER